MAEIAGSVRERLFELSRFMQEFKHKFSLWFNSRHERHGTVWEERFKPFSHELHSTVEEAPLSQQRRVRDVTFGEDRCRVARPKAARIFVTLRNLAIGLYNLLKHREKTTTPSLPSWQRSISNAHALRHVLR